MSIVGIHTSVGFLCLNLNYNNRTAYCVLGIAEEILSFDLTLITYWLLHSCFAVTGTVNIIIVIHIMLHISIFTDHATGVTLLEELVFCAIVLSK